MLKYFAIILLFCSCSPTISNNFYKSSNKSLTGTEFYKQAMKMQWQQRDSFAVARILNGNIPSFLKKMKKINVSLFDSASGKSLKATYFVTSDYLSIGSNRDWARIPLTPIAAQKIADSFNCFLPTRKIVDDIYSASKIKLEPVPMYIHRDSTITMWQHHLIIEGQRKGRTGLISGIKKDVVISGKINRSEKRNRVAIYGWHQLNGKPIQPVYTGHVNWYADYSHGIRLVYRKIKVNGKWMDYTEILRDKNLQKLICDEDWCDFYRY